MKLDDIQEAQVEGVTHTVMIPFQIRNGDGSFHEMKLRVVYRPFTPEILDIGGLAEQLAAVVVEWDAEEPPSLETFRVRNVKFLRRLSEAITQDFFQAKKP